MFKRFAMVLVFLAVSTAAFAEASFQQIEGLIEQKNYAAAEAGLEGIIANHPNSAKAFYAMAQAQAGLGNLEKAQRALNKAKGLDPELKFATSSNIESLQQAITPQTAKIEVVTESHVWRNLIILILIAGSGYFAYSMYRRSKDEEEAEAAAREREHQEALERIREANRKEREELQAKEAALRAHPNYGHERFDPANPDVLLPKKTKAQLKAEADALALREAQARAERAEAEARAARSYSAPQPTTVVNNNGGGTGDFVTGMLVGNMLSSSHHDHTTIIERDVYVAPPPAPSRDSSWDSDSSSTKSSSWDSDSSSSSSSSWSSSSSDSDSSWSSSSSDSSSSGGGDW